MKYLESLLEIAKEASISAGNEIVSIYQRKHFLQRNKIDNSPVTEADEQAHRIIVEKLQQTGIPVLSEEGNEIDYHDRKDLDYLWIVDPLDGTKEFINKNDEFTVNIALIKGTKSILGVVYVPVFENLYWAKHGSGAFMSSKNKEPIALRNKKKALSKKKILTSRSHHNQETESYLNDFLGAEIERVGSSLKFMLLAENEADQYPKFGTTMEWDTAAAQVILEEVGGKVLNLETNQPLRYNKKDLRNPFFIAYSN